MATQPGLSAHAAADPTVTVLGEAIRACRDWGRDDLAQRLRLAEARLTRPSTLACVVGEYKQGKSLLVNALVGADVCPVDDDRATATFTIVAAAEEASASVHRTVDGQPTIEPMALEDARRYMTESGDPAAGDGVELVEVGLPGSTAPDGLALVDSPGVGGLLDQHAGATIRFLQLADAVVFVTDASQELTAPEVAFLERARQVCPTVLLVVSKVDLYPAWRRIVELDRAHLAARDVPLRPIAVSASVAREGRTRLLPDLEAESGIVTLRERLRQDILEGARERALARAAAETRWALQRLREPIASELMVLEDPARASEQLARLRAAEERLLALQTAGARWATVLGDGFADLRADLDHRIRRGVRALLAELDQRLDDVDPAREWDDLTSWLRSRLAAQVDDVFATIDTQAAEIEARVAAVLLAESPDLAAAGRGGLDVTELWATSDRTLKARHPGPVASGLTALRGGSSGVILLGMVARLAGLAVATPASIGIAVVFGAKQVMDARKQELVRRRQEARTVARQFVEEVSLELGNRSARLVQEDHRALRDGFAARLQELSLSARGAVEAAQTALAADTKARQERPAPLRAWLQTIDSLLARPPGETDVGADPR